MKITDVNFGKGSRTKHLDNSIQRFFKELGLNTIKEVVDYPMHDLIEIKGFGRRSFTAVQCVFIELGIINEIDFK